MARSVNSVTLVGNLGANPEIRTTSAGAKVAQFSLATSRQWTAPNGEKQERTEWHRCLAWNVKGKGLADIAEKYLKKGDKLYVTGRIEYRQFEDKDGATHYVTEINVREVLMLGSAKPHESAATPAKPAKSAGEHDEFPPADGDDDLPF